MYSVVLMMALTGGAESVDFGGRRGGCSGSNGCHGAVSASHGCNGGNGHGCHGRGGLFGGHRDRGCHGDNGCSGRGHGLFHGRRNRCNGNGHGCHGSNGHGCHASSYGHAHGYGCSGSSHHGAVGCHGSSVGGAYHEGTDRGRSAEPLRVDPKTMPKDKGKNEEVSSEAPATIIVTLPAEAKLSVDGNVTRSTSARRTFVTPALEAGANFVYTLRAETNVDGQVSVQTRDVTVRGGQTTLVSFTFASQGVASR